MNSRYTYAMRIAYLFMLGLSLYLLVAAHAAENHTVWETINPVFIPVFFATTTLLLILVFSESEKVKFKLLFVIMYSILCRSFSAIIFPAGGIGPQQGESLSITKLLFDSGIRGGWTPWTPSNVPVLLFNWFRGENFQGTLSITFGRMLGVDLFWVHVFLAPVLWGIFVSISIFAVTRALGGNETTSVLASLLITAFPLAVLWGTFSVPNSLGYVFFLLSVLFFMRYLSSPKFKVILLMAAFLVASFQSHLLTGIMSLSILLLTIAVKASESEKKEAPLTAKTTLISAFVLSTIILPFSLLFLRLVYAQYIYFSLNAFRGLTVTEILGLFFLGEYVSFSIESLPVFLVGPVLGFVGVVYVLQRRRKEVDDQHVSFSLLLVSLGYLLVLVDYRILKLFMVNVPFGADRLYVFEYLLVTPFLALLIYDVTKFLHTGSKPADLRSKSSSASSAVVPAHLNVRRIAVYGVITILLAAWLTASVYNAYPHYGFLQITDYEIEAAKYMETHTNKTYIVICDLWFAYAGGMQVGINNTRAFYFSSASRGGVELYSDLTAEPTPSAMNQTLTRMERDGFHFQIVYFVVEEPRLGADKFQRVVTNALQNNLTVFYKYPSSGDAKLYVFSYER